MRRLIVTLLLSLLCLGARAQELDSLTRVRLSDKLEEYFDAVKTLDIEAQKEEVDFIIEAVSDSLVRQFVAVKVYDHYLGSPVMGSEAVAIHVLDRWFLSGQVKMYNDVDLLHARVFAEFNRQSLLGMDAPELSLLTYDGQMMSLYDGPSDKYTVLYFYDTGCSKCKLENLLLAEAFAAKTYPIEFYAVYSGSNKELWKAYLDSNFQFGGIPVTHLWDPELDSDFQRKYGVLQTPRMYLIAPDGKIVGRGLDTGALIQLLDMAYAERNLEYGSTESAELFDRLLGPAPSRTEIADVAKMLEDATLGAGNQLMYRQLIGDYLYYLAPKTGEEFKEGLYRFIGSYILDRDDIWTSEDDELKVVGFAEIMYDLLSKAVPGTRIADLKVEGEYVKGSRSSVKKKSLRKLGGEENIIIFHTEGCHICAAQIAAARALAAGDSKVRVYLVNVDEIIDGETALSAAMFETFDLSALPYVVKTDKKGKIIRRYFSL